MSKHTPGPWNVAVPPSACLTTRFIEAETGEHIAKIGHMDYSSGSQESDLANARLIAQAPAMFDVLIQAIEESGHKVSGPTDWRVAEDGEPLWVCKAREAGGCNGRIQDRGRVTRIHLLTDQFPLPRRTIPGVTNLGLAFAGNAAG